VIDWLLDPLDYPFMQRALLEVIIVGVVCGLVGCFVVLRGLAFIGDALAHAVFPGVVLSYLADRSILIGAFVFGSLTALGIGILSRSRRVSEDSAIGVLFAASFALGVVLVSREAGFRRDVTSLLFGNILGVSDNDVLITLAIGSVIVVVLFALLKEFTIVAFDATMARASGYPVFALDITLLLLVSATIVMSLQTVGNILVLALIVTPPATARLLTDEKLNRTPRPAEAAADEDAPSVATRPAFRFRFSLRQLLVAMTVAGVIFGVVSVLGGPANTATILGFTALVGLVIHALGFEPPQFIVLGWWMILVLYVLLSIVTVVWSSFA
jgi:manganese/iron transport system permease protein